MRNRELAIAARLGLTPFALFPALSPARSFGTDTLDRFARLEPAMLGRREAALDLGARLHQLADRRFRHSFAARRAARRSRRAASRAASTSASACEACLRNGLIAAARASADSRRSAFLGSRAWPASRSPRTVAAHAEDRCRDSRRACRRRPSPCRHRPAAAGRRSARADAGRGSPRPPRRRTRPGPRPAHRAPRRRDGWSARRG